MLGALVLSALALSVPHTGQPYVAYKHEAAGELSCSGVIGGKPVPVRYRQTGDATVCVFLIPKRTAGKWLIWNHSVTTTVSGGMGFADGIPRRQLIRR